MLEENSQQFLSYGKKHAKLWHSIEAAGPFQSTQLTFGKLPMQNVHSAVFLQPKAAGGQSTVVAGVAGGEIYIFQVLCAANEDVLLQIDIKCSP